MEVSKRFPNLQVQARPLTDEWRSHLLATEGLKNGEQRFMRNGVTGYAEEAVERDRRGVVLPE